MRGALILYFVPGKTYTRHRHWLSLQRWANVCSGRVKKCLTQAQNVRKRTANRKKRWRLPSAFRNSVRIEWTFSLRPLSVLTRPVERFRFDLWNRGTLREIWFRCRYPSRLYTSAQTRLYGPTLKRVSGRAAGHGRRRTTRWRSVVNGNDCRLKPRKTCTRPTAIV